MGVMVTNLSALLLMLVLVAPVSQPKPLIVETSMNLWRMISGQLSQYPEGRQLVRDVLGLPDPTPAPKSSDEAVPGSGIPTTPVGSSQEVGASRPPVVGGQDPVLPRQVGVEASQGHLSLQPVGVVFRSPQNGYMRIRLDISPLHRQLQEVQHHFRSNGYPTIQKNPSDSNLCLSEGDGRFISLHQAMMSGKGGPVTGKLNDTHSGTHVQGNNLQENCTLKDSDLAMLSGKFYYAHDFAMQLLLRQATKCVSSVDQALLRFTVGKRWGNTKASRDVLGMLGLGGLALGVVNRFELDSLEGRLNQVGHQVDALVGEQHLLSKVTGALIDSQAKLHKTILVGEVRAILTDSLAKMNTMVSTSCHIASNLKNLLTELRNHQFPGEFFDKVQLDEHFEAFTVKVGKAGLEPIFPSATSLWSSRVQSMVQEETISLPKEKEGAKTNAESNVVGVHVFQAAKDSSLPDNKTTKVKVVLPKATAETDQVAHEHEDHDFKDTLFKDVSKGLVVYLLIPIPLKRQGEDGYTLYKLSPTLMSLKPNFSAAQVEEGSTLLHHPIPVQPIISGGLLVPRMRSSESKLIEVDDDFLDSCEVIEGVVHVCSDPRVRPGPLCLTEVFHNQPHSKACLNHYKILDPHHPHLHDTGQGQVQLFVPPATKLYTVCPGQVHHKLWKIKPGLHSVSLPHDCTLKIGGLRYTALRPFEVPGSLTFSADLQELSQLMHIQKVVEQDNWQRLKELLQEQRAEELTLRDLQRRLEETKVQAFTRKNPTALTYYSLAAGAIVVCLIGSMVVFLVKYLRTCKERRAARISQLQGAQRLYRSTRRQPATEVDERQVPMLPNTTPALEYNPDQVQ